MFLEKESQGEISSQAEVGVTEWRNCENSGHPGGVNLESQMDTAIKSNYYRSAQLGKPATSHTKARFRAVLFQGCWSRLRDRKEGC